MKKQHIMLVAGIGLIAVFVAAGYLYKSEKSEQLQAMATSEEESPLNRSYAQSVGPQDAKVTIVEFFDPACETCAVFAPMVKKLVEMHEGKVRLVLRYAPLHQGSDKIVKILEAARLQDRYWETLHVMFGTQQHWASHHNPQPDRIWRFLQSVDMDLAKLQKDMESPVVLNILNQDMADAKTLGAHKTPTFLVNGKPLPSFGFEQLEHLVASEVAANYGQ